MEEWSRCVSARYQRDALYRHGQFDSCSEQYSDLKNMVYAKSLSDEQKSKDLETQTFYRTHLGSDPKNSPTAGFIWDLKKVPGWEVEEPTEAE